MSDCPELSQLDSHRASIRDHVVGCTSCRIARELLDERKRGHAARDRDAECTRFELLIAARDDGSLGASAAELLDAHLLVCANCSAVAVTLPPLGGARELSSLPAIDTSAYALGPEVARGGMGRILRATDVRIGRQVAVKELLDKNPALAARFEREAMVTARLQHPGIVPIYEIGRWPDGTPFYTMRLVDGRTLRAALRVETLDERLKLLPALIAAAEAVGFAHAHRVIHRDLTPNNILVGDHGETVVIDWGLAKDLSREEPDVAASPYRDRQVGAGLTVAGAVVGTAAFMPPEQARGETVDERADVYALGAVLYYLLAGSPPYRSDATKDILASVQAGPPAPIANAAASAPRDLVSIVEKAMARDPGSRYANAGALAAELRRFQTGRVVEAHVYSQRERVRRWVGRHRVGVFASAAAIVALVVAGTIGVAGVLRERDRAEREAANAVAATRKSQRENAALMTEQGRQELVAGNTTRALAWLTEAYKAGDTSPELRFLLGTAMRQIESIDRTVDCGSEIKSIQVSRDQTKLLVACAYSIGLGTIEDGKVLMAKRILNGGAVLSPDATRILSRRYDHVTLLDATTGAELYERKAHDGMIRLTAFTPDGTRLITTGDDGKARIWDVATGTALHVLAAQTGAANVIRGDVTPDGRTVVTATADGTVIVWDLATGARLRSFKMPVQAVIGEERFISPDSKWMVACGTDGTVRTFELATGRLRASFVAHPDASLACSIDPAGTRLLTTGIRDGTAKVWDLGKQQLLQSFPHGDMLLVARFSPDGQRVVTSAYSGNLKIWHVATGSLLASIDDPSAKSDFIVFTGDGRRLITAREPYQIVIHKDLAAVVSPRDLPVGSAVVDVSPTAEQLAVADAAGRITLVDATTQATVTHEPMTKPARWSRDGTRFFGTAPTGGTVVIDAKTGKTLTKLATPKTEWLEPDRQGKRLALVGASPPQVWDVDAGKVLRSFEGHTRAETLSGSGRFILAWSDPRKLEVWNLDEDAIAVTLSLDAPIGHGVDYGPDERTVVIAQQDESPGPRLPFLERASVYDLRTGKVLYTAPSRMFTNLDPSGRWMVSSGLNGKLELRRTSDGSLVSAMAIPGSSPFLAGQATPSGELIVVNDFRNVVVRSAVDARVLGVISAKIQGLQFSQDGANFGAEPFAMGHDGRTIIMQGPSPLVWRLPREERSPADVDRIVRDRIRWQVLDGRLVPVQAALRGRVVRNGKPVAGAKVAIASPVWTYALSDADGRFEFPEVMTGELFVIAMAPELDAKGNHTVVMTRDGVTRDFELDERATIAGTVVDDAGTPVAGLTVRAGFDDGALRAITQADGTFVIRALDAGSYKVHVMKVVDDKDAGIEPLEPRMVSVEVPSRTAAVAGVRLVVRKR